MSYYILEVLIKRMFEIKMISKLSGQYLIVLPAKR